MTDTWKALIFRLFILQGFQASIFVELALTKSKNDTQVIIAMMAKFVVPVLPKNGQFWTRLKNGVAQTGGALQLSKQYRLAVRTIHEIVMGWERWIMAQDSRLYQIRLNKHNRKSTARGDRAMGRRITIQPHLSVEELLSRYREAKGATERSH